MAVNIARGMDSSTTLLLKAQLEYSRGNHREAIKLLTTGISSITPGLTASGNTNGDQRDVEALAQQPPHWFFVVTEHSLIPGDVLATDYVLGMNRLLQSANKLDHCSSTHRTVHNQRCFIFMELNPQLW